MTHLYADISGYLIAGGRSRRFGSDKRLIDLDGETLLDRAGRVMRETLGELPTLVGDDVESLSDKSWRILSDAKSQSGPLGGLVAALEDCSAEWIMTLAVDLPYMSPEDLRLLAESRNDEYDALTLTIDGRPEPLAALYHRRTASFWRTWLDRNQLSVSGAMGLLNWKPVLLDQGSRSLTNINVPADLEM